MKCPECQGDGWDYGHSCGGATDKCLRSCPTQEPCANCLATGEVPDDAKEREVPMPPHIEPASDGDVTRWKEVSAAVLEQHKESAIVSDRWITLDIRKTQLDALFARIDADRRLLAERDAEIEALKSEMHKMREGFARYQAVASKRNLEKIAEITRLEERLLEIKGRLEREAAK